jgi:hypothetical protein
MALRPGDFYVLVKPLTTDEHSRHQTTNPAVSIVAWCRPSPIFGPNLSTVLTHERPAERAMRRGLVSLCAL